MNILSTAGNFLKTNAPSLLTGLGIAGVFSTAVLAARGGQKANQYLSEQPADLTAREKFEATWQFYIPAGISLVGSVACIIGAQTLNARRQAMLLGLYTMSEGALSEYKDKVVEILGENRDKEVVNAIAQDKANALDPQTTYILSDKEVLCYDTLTGRVFKSDMESLRKAQNDINETVINDWCASQNEFYDKIGLERVEIGEELGWNTDNMMELQITSVLHDGKPMLAVDYRRRPKLGFQRVF